jgi:hypothetical protein
MNATGSGTSGRAIPVESRATCGGVSGDASAMGLTSGDEWLTRLIRSSTKVHSRDVDVAMDTPAEEDDPKPKP